jgi:hypothetical protein
VACSMFAPARARHDRMIHREPMSLRALDPWVKRCAKGAGRPFDERRAPAPPWRRQATRVVC